MFYRKPVGRIWTSTTYYKKKFDWVYFIGGIIGAIVLLAMYG